MPLFLLSTNAEADSTRIVPAGGVLEDVRLQPLKNLDGYFPFTPPTSLAEWEQRAERLRRRILVSQGLWPMPTKTPLNPVFHGQIDRGDFTVEKVYFESMPGLFVTGNLYRPKNARSKVPGVLVAHGHWDDARIGEVSEDETRRAIANGEERFDDGGRRPFQAICVQLARMGCIVFQWDMLGYSDSRQLSRELVHQFAHQRPEMNTIENWGLFSPQAEAHLQNVMGLQTWNAVRSLDFLISLCEVDSNRIAMTGASGGGTQTMLLSAIDPRMKLSFPAVMVSTAMQGGCTCENAALLRVGTGNVEFAALFAPKPQGMTTANDWTREFSAKGFPELKQLYTFLGAADNVMLKRGEHFPHNYNAVSRSAFYGWVNRHFNLGQTEPIIERDFGRFTREELSVWDAQHPEPTPGDQEFERHLLRWWHEDAQKQLAASATDPARFREDVGRANGIILNKRTEAGAVNWTATKTIDRATWSETTGLMRNDTYGEELPTVILRPNGNRSGRTVIWLGKDGKSELYAPNGALAPEIQALVQAGTTVVGADLLYQGEFLADGNPLDHTPRVKNPREAAAFTFGYNDALFVQRVHDILNLVNFVKGNSVGAQRVDVVGVDGAGPWVAAARAQVGALIDRAVIDTEGLRFARVLDLRDPNFLPGGAKYGDLPAMLALGAPEKLWVAGETEKTLALARSLYRAANAEKNLTLFNGSSSLQIHAAVIAWLLAAD